MLNCNERNHRTNWRVLRNVLCIKTIHENSSHSFYIRRIKHTDKLKHSMCHEISFSPSSTRILRAYDFPLATYLKEDTCAIFNYLAVLCFKSNEWVIWFFSMQTVCINAMFGGFHGNAAHVPAGPSKTVKTRTHQASYQQDQTNHNSAIQIWSRCKILLPFSVILKLWISVSLWFLMHLFRIAPLPPLLPVTEHI